jgi:hypothetical protein
MTRTYIQASSGIRTHDLSVRAIHELLVYNVRPLWSAD